MEPMCAADCTQWVEVKGHHTYTHTHTHARTQADNKYTSAQNTLQIDRQDDGVLTKAALACGTAAKSTIK